MTVASGVWAGAIPLDRAWNCTEVHSSDESKEKTMKEELERIGFLGDVPATHEAQPIAAHFELHIEQGPILEDEGRKVGVVVGAQAYQWFEVEIRGKSSHAGTTPLNARKDALLAAAKMIVASNQIAKDVGGVITTGIIQAEPSSINTVANTVRFTLDIRHPSDGVVSDMVERCREAFNLIAKQHRLLGGKAHLKRIAENAAVDFHGDCISAVEQSAAEICDQLRPHQTGAKLWRPMTSGAGHDSCQVSRKCPTAMIFAPTRDGMSHTPDEYCSPEDCAITTQVLLGAVLRYDAMRASRGDFA